MPFIIAGLIIDFFIMISIYPSLSQEPRYEELALPFTIACVVSMIISIIGLLCIFGKKYKIGMPLLIIGSIVFLPLGILIVLGASKLRAANDNASGQDLEQRRQLNTEQQKSEEEPKQIINETELVQPTVENELESDILTFSASKFATQQRVMGIISIIMGVLVAAVSAMGGLFIAMGILGIIMSFVLKNDNYITLGHDYIAMKFGVRAQVNVLFKEITSIEKTDKKMIIHYQPNDRSTGNKKLVLALNAMTDEEKEQFLSMFDKRTQAI